MRKIKFRVFNRDTGEMWIGGYVQFDTGNVWFDNEDGDMCEYTQDEFPLMQYTGLKDRQGKDIYEGDIVKCYERAKYQRVLSPFNAEVVFDNGIFTLQRVPNGWNSLYLHLLSIKVEVIGNIYENSELLKS